VGTQAIASSTANKREKEIDKKGFTTAK